MPGCYSSVHRESADENSGIKSRLLMTRGIHVEVRVEVKVEVTIELRLDARRIATKNDDGRPWSIYDTSSELNLLCI